MRSPAAGLLMPRHTAFTRIIAITTTLVCAMSFTALCQASSSWPELPLPEGARAEVVSHDGVFNGRRIRILRARLDGSMDEVLAFYRSRFGPRHVENPLRGSRVIATRQGDHFNTVQLRELAPGRLQATLMSTLMTGDGEVSKVLRDTQRMLPADSTVVNTMESDDDGHRAVMVTAVNGATLTTNRDELVRALRERGMSVSREDRTRLARGQTLTLWADNTQESITLTIVDDGEQRVVVLNRVRVRALQP